MWILEYYDYSWEEYFNHPRLNEIIYSYTIVYAGIYEFATRFMEKIVNIR